MVRGADLHSDVSESLLGAMAELTGVLTAAGNGRALPPVRHFRFVMRTEFVERGAVLLSDSPHPG